MTLKKISFGAKAFKDVFAGSTVRKITRDMGTVDPLNDTLLIALIPSVVVLAGTTVLLGMHWPVMGWVAGLGSLLYIAVTMGISPDAVAPAARFANLWDTGRGGALVDAVNCNAVVKAHGAETREDARIASVIGKWCQRTRRTWTRGPFNGGAQGLILVAMQAAIVGDITFALTMFCMLRGYLSDGGMQRSIDDMEERVALESQPLGIEDKPLERPIAID
jgi:ATP-binding cassette subfamily B protein